MTEKQSGGYLVSTAALASHASVLDAVVDRVANANAAAETVGTGGWEMYGMLCSPILMPVLANLYGDTDDLLTNAVELGRTCAEGLRTAQQNYDEAERCVIEQLGDIS